MSDLREALKTLRDANMSYSLVSDVKNARRLEQAMRDAEAALSQPEAVKPVAFMFWNEPDVTRHFTQLRESIGSHWTRVKPLYTTPPLAPDERMRRALEKIKQILADCGGDFHICPQCRYQDNNAIYESDLRLLIKDVIDELSRADKGKESEGTTQDTETIHQTIYKHAYKSLKGRVSERFLQEEFWLAAEDAAKEIALTLPDAREGEAMTWDNRYRMLNEGEIIREGDECLTDSHLGWQPAKHDIGAKAPSPFYSSHRLYRRTLSEQEECE